MEAIILAGGRGTRLRKVINNMPKVMAPINGKPFLTYLLDNLSGKGFQRLILSLGYMANHVSDYFGNKYRNMELTYTIEDNPLGTGGAIRAALAKCKNDYVYIFNGDTFIDLEIPKIEELMSHCTDPVIVVRKVVDTKRYGRLIVQNNRIIKFSEKNMSGNGYINAGCYVFPKNILDSYPVGKQFSIELEYFTKAVEHQRFVAFFTRGKFIDIGIPADYKKAEKLLIHT